MEESNKQTETKPCSIHGVSKSKFSAKKIAEVKDKMTKQIEIC